MVSFDPTPRLHEPIDLYNSYCDAIRSRSGSYEDKPFAGVTSATELVPGAKTRNAAKPRETVVFQAPLCSEHEFVSGEPIAGFKGEILAQTRICLRCGHAEREKV